MKFSANDRRAIEFFRANPGSTFTACANELTGGWADSKYGVLLRLELKALAKARILLETGKLSAKHGVEYVANEAAICDAVIEDRAWFQRYAPAFKFAGSAREILANRAEVA